MKFSYNTGIFRLRPLSDAIEVIAKAGFSAVELIADRPHAFPEDLTAPQITEINKCLEERKITICNLDGTGVILPGEASSPSWIEEDWKKREGRIRYTLDCLRLAAAMGIRSVSTMAGGPIPETMNRFDATRLFVANLHRVVPLARKLGVRLLIQPEPELLVETSDHVIEVLKDLEFDEYLRVDFDAGHFFCVEEDPCEAWKKLKAYVDHVHLEDIPASRTHRHTQLGEGAMDIPAFLQCLDQSEYTGCVTVRLESHDQGSEETVLASAHYLAKIGFPLKGNKSFS